MNQKARKTLPQSSSLLASKPTAVHPCFCCGLIFAKKDEFTEHMERFHPSSNNQSKTNDRFKCHECGQSFPNDPKSYKEHLLFHDLGKILAALKHTEMSKKRHAPIVVRPSINEIPSNPSNLPAIIAPRVELSPKEIAEKPSPSTADSSSTLQTANIGKQKGRPRSKSIFSTISKSLPTSTSTALSTPQMESPNKRRRISNDTSVYFSSPSVQQETTALATSTPMSLLTSDTLPLVGQRISPLYQSKFAQLRVLPPMTFTQQESTTLASSVPTPPIIGDTKSKMQDHRATPVIFSASQPMPQFQQQVLPPAPKTLPSFPSQTSSHKTLSAVHAQSVCPHCEQDLGKPWHLVEHMIQRHDAQLLRLVKTLRKLDSSVGNTITSQAFNDYLCPFCKLIHDDLPSCLLHVIRTHRSRLFECPENWECTLTCELICAIGQDSASKKFTINIKVKRIM